MTLSEELERTLYRAYEQAKERRHEFITPEHLLFELINDEVASVALTQCGADLETLKGSLDNFLRDKVPSVTLNPAPEPVYSDGSKFILRITSLHAESAEAEEINGCNLLISMFRLRESHAVFFLREQGVGRYELKKYISHNPVSSDLEDTGYKNMGRTITETKKDQRDALAVFCTDLVKNAQEGRIDPIIGRENELERVVHILSRRRKNNPILVGDAGVGKTAIAEGLAYKIIKKEVPTNLQNTNIYALDMGTLTAGTRYRGDFEERLKGIIEAAKNDPSTVLFIDEIHTVIGAGAVSGGSLDASNMLKPVLASGEIKCIGTTTLKEFRSIFEKDNALARRFQKVDVHEPSEDESVRILNGIKKYYEQYHKVYYSPKAIKASVELSAKFMNDRRLPDKAIDVLDETGAAVKLKNDEKEYAQVTVKDVESTVAKIAKIPSRTVRAEDKSLLLNMEDSLKKYIYGQDRAIEKLVTSIHISRAGLKELQKPIGSFMFSGPTGVGKTELAKKLAEILGTEFIRFDMSEYMEKHTVSRLIGSPPGYVGFDQGGQLTEAVNRSPHSVLLLDEIEKAHEDIYNVLLQVMDHASLTDSNGRKVDFRQVVLIFTTNTGSRESSKRNLGFTQKEFEDRSSEAIENFFSPEFRNRLTAILQFGALDQATIEKIVDKTIGELEDRVSAKKIKIKLSEEARKYIAQNGYDELLGARPIKRLIDTEITEKLSKELLFGNLPVGGTVNVVVENDALKLCYS